MKTWIIWTLGTICLLWISRRLRLRWSWNRLRECNFFTPVDFGSYCRGCPSQELVVATFGPSMAIVTSVTILAFLVGSLISYFIITGLHFALLLPLEISWEVRIWTICLRLAWCPLWKACDMITSLSNRSSRINFLFISNWIYPILVLETEKKQNGPQWT